MPTTKGLYTTNRTYVGMLRGTYATVAYVIPPVYTTDPLFSFNSLLLPGETDYLPFNADNSLNNFNVNVLGDAKASNFSPYTGGYYSVFFDGTGDYLSTATNTAFGFGTGDFTIEFWTLWGGTFNSLNGGSMIELRAAVAAEATVIYLSTSGVITFYDGPSNAEVSSGITITSQWTHIALARQSGVWRLFINGSLAVSRTSNTDLGSTKPVLIGQGINGATTSYNGYISNVRIVKGTALYTAAFTPPISPLVAISGTSLLTCQSNRFKDDSSTAATITVSGDAKISAADPFDVPESFASYGSTYLDGTGDYLSIPATSLFAFGTLNFTVEAWIYPLAYGGSTVGASIFGTVNGSTSGYSLNLGQTQDTMRIISNATGTWADNLTVSAGGGAPLNTWSHIAWVRNGNSMTIYKNGISVGTMSGVSAYNFTSPSNAGYAGVFNDGSYTRNFNGHISDLRVVRGTAIYTGNFTPPSAPISISGSPTQYPNTANVNTSFPSANTLLSLLQYSQPHNNSTFLDKSNFRQVITRNGNSQQGSFSPYGANWSAYFDGTGDYLTLSDNAQWVMDTDYTVEFWFYASSFPGQYNNFINQYGGASSYWGINYDTSLGWCFFYHNGAGEQKTARNQNSPLNNWVHIAVVKSGTTGYMFINGTQAGATFSFPTINDVSSSLYIGAWSTPGDYINGYLSNLRMVKGTALYTSNFTPSTSPLTAISGTQLLTCQSNRFKDNSTNNFAITVNGDTSIQKTSPFGLTANASPILTGGSLYIDGTGDYLDFPASNPVLKMGTDNFTIEFWVYPTTAPNNNWSPFLTIGNSGGGQEIRISQNLNGTGFGYLIPNNSNNADVYPGFGTLPLFQWSHIALVRVGSTVTMYRNGISVGSTTSVSFNHTNTTVCRIGYPQPAYADGSTAGYISDFRIVKNAVYIGNFAPPSLPLTLSGNSSIYSSTTNVNTSFSVANTAAMLNFTEGAIKDATTYFNLETAADAKLGFETAYSGSYYSNYFPNAPTGTSGFFVPDNAGFDFSNGDFTVEAHINLTAGRATGGSTAAVVYGQVQNIASNSNRSHALQIFNTALTFYYTTDGGTDQTINWSYNFNLNTWYHVAVARSGNNIYGFVNGVLISSQSFSVTIFNSSAPLAIGLFGRYPIDDGYTGLTFPGYISNLRIVKGTALYTSNFTPSTSPLTAVPGTALLTCQSNRFIDNSTNNLTTTVNGGPEVRSFNPFQRNPGSSLYFDGTGDYLRIVNNQSLALGTGNFTIEFWANMTTNPSNQVILDQRPDGSHGAYPAILFESKYIRWYVSSATRIQSTSTLTLNTWYHVAICRVSGTTTMYINGNVSGSTWADSTNYLTGAAGLVIGASTWSGGSANMNGYIDDLRITRGNARYTANFTPSITMLSVR